MAAWLSGYTTRRRLTIVPATRVDATLTDFPVQVRLRSTNFDFARANANGFDIRFTSSDGTTLLNYERERHDNVSSLGEYWVRLPSVSATVNTEFFIYYRTAVSTDGANPTAVWDVNFRGVWHLRDLTTSSVRDSTVNNNTGNKRAANEPIETDGIIGRGQNFDGVNDVITAPDSVSLNLASTGTIESWVRIPSNLAIWGVLASKRTTGAFSGFSYGLDLSSSGRNIRGLVSNGSSGNIIQGATALTLDTWNHVAFVWNGTSLRVYLNSVSDATPVSQTANPFVNTFPLTIGGCIATPDGWYRGIIDEMQISSIARTSAWIRASFHSGNNSLLTYGGEEVSISVSDSGLGVDTVGVNAMIPVVDSGVGLDTIQKTNRLLIQDSGIGTDTIEKLEIIAIIVGLGQFALSSIDIGFRRTINILVTRGTFVLTGIGGIFYRIVSVIAERGTFILTGMSGLLHRILSLMVARGTFVLTGVNIVLERLKRIITATGKFVFTGLSAIMKGSGDWLWKKDRKNTAIWTELTSKKTDWVNKNKS